ncbi:hypothetical protein WG901_22735 [Novosphingobium sp. PS1R-30]|uniref:Mobilization protein n=1 Tax=Novosphingobium anseongense TaxID=3133436 RepID=A0ABU8S2P8_9SPHN
MTQHQDTDIAEIDPSQAFQELRREVILMKRHVENLAAVPDRMHDYTPTLSAMEQSLKSIRAGLARIESSPAVKLTHEAVHEKIVALSQVIRAEDRQMLIEAQNAMAQAVGRIDGIVERGQAAHRDKRKEHLHAACFVAIGMLVWSIIPGPIARLLPESWHVPEWMASKTMGLPMKDAGAKLYWLAREREPRLTVIAEPTATPSNAVPRNRRKSRR